MNRFGVLIKYKTAVSNKVFTEFMICEQVAVNHGDRNDQVITLWFDANNDQEFNIDRIYWIEFLDLPVRVWNELKAVILYLSVKEESHRMFMRINFEPEKAEEEEENPPGKP